jgi:UDP-N-acetylglucosamine 2-epimerase (non-hydrolysing)
MNEKLISLVVGARPNFMKIAPLVRALENVTKDFIYRIIHTGQHNSSEMNDVFFSDLGIPEPHVYLKGSGGTHAEQTARIMIDFEADCVKYKPDIVLVVGDVNSTLACAIVSKKLCIKLVHVEAGLRSGDHEMPEEINRMVTDSIADLFFVTEPAGVDNLLREGHDKNSIHYVGNVMIDNLSYQVTKLNKMDPSIFMTNKLKNTLGSYGVLTLHRPSNVDNLEKLSQIIKAINKISDKLSIIFPIHPRTKKNLEQFNIEFSSNIFLIPSLPYMEFLNIWRDAEVVLTDSGGLQEETTALGVPCITLRENTERPITVEKGTNRVVGTKYSNIIANVDDVLSQSFHKKNIPKYWDGNASKRIIKVLLEN